MAAESIGTRIRDRRQYLRLTQRELARRVGVDRTTVSTWERDQHYPGRYLAAIEAELGISLRTGSGAEPEYDDPALQHIWETPGLPEDVRRGLVALAIGWRTQARSRRAS